MKGVVVWSVDKSDFLSEGMSKQGVAFWYSTRIHVAATYPITANAVHSLVNELVSQMVGTPDNTNMQVVNNTIGSLLYFSSREEAMMFYLIMKEWQE